MPQIMTTKELARYLKLHEITICKYAAEGRIPAVRIGRVWRFDREVIDKWIAKGAQRERREKENRQTQRHRSAMSDPAWLLKRQSINAGKR